MADLRKLTAEQRKALGQLLEQVFDETDEEKLERLIQWRETIRNRARKCDADIKRLKNKLHMRKARGEDQK